MRLVAWSLLVLSACDPGVVESADTGTASPDAAPPAVDAAVDTFRGERGTLLFVTQVPVAGFATATSAFGNHLPAMTSAPRGGGLMIRYPNGALRDLTAEAGYGEPGAFQGAGAVALREPSVHWDGNRALFSMVVGGTVDRYRWDTFVWQIYEVEGLAAGDPVSIRRIDGQPEDNNNVSPVYGTDDQIIFVSDRTPRGEPHLYPQRDEYESSPTVAGIYRLDEETRTLTLIEHAPSGVFGLSIDGAGRVIFTKWDHLQRDQQGDAPGVAARYEPLTYQSEAVDAAVSTSIAGAEVYPEPRSLDDLDFAPGVARHTFNQFVPWEVNEDGSAEETLNHVGRHELGGTYSAGSFEADPSLTFVRSMPFQANTVRISGSSGLFHLREDPGNPGRFYATYSPEFYTATGGSLVWLDGQVDTNPEDMVLTEVTSLYGTSEGLFRNPVPLTDGTLVAVHAEGVDEIDSIGSTEAPAFSGSYRLRTVADGVAGALLTEGLTRDVEYWSPDVLVQWSGTLWELDPVEVAPRPRPAPRQAEIPAEELAVFAAAGVDVAAYRAWLRDRDLALIVSRDVTQRDRADLQQPYSLRVPGGVSSITGDGPVYDVVYLQLFQADLVRGYGDADDPSPGRRVLARPMHGSDVSVEGGVPDGAVSIATDGSFAALVPAGRALTWQLVDASGMPVVRERNWISFAAGEVRVCAACHGINTVSQTGEPTPANEPMALAALLDGWSP